jgi:hypothetical protein
MSAGTSVGAVTTEVSGRMRGYVSACMRPFGYLAFVLALAALSTAATLLGKEDGLGFFSGRLSDTIRRYPEVTRRGVQIAWLVWAVLFILAVSPLSPTHWDEVGLGALALIVLWRRAVR